jgi:hypothetical protein
MIWMNLRGKSEAEDRWTQIRLVSQECALDSYFFFSSDAFVLFLIQKRTHSGIQTARNYKIGPELVELRSYYSE